MSNPEDGIKFIRGQRKGKDGRIFNVPIKVPIEYQNFKGATARAEVFVPDSATYQPATYNGPLLLNGLRNVNGHWIPGQAYIFNRPFIFYPPPDDKQHIRPCDRNDVKRSRGPDRIKWTNGAPRPQDMVLQNSVQFPHQTTPEDRVAQRPMARHVTPVFKPVNEKLLEKKLIDGKWGAYIDINFPERKLSRNKEKEWILESDPIKKFFLPYTTEYKYYYIKTVNHKAKWDNDKFIPVPEQWYRFWPPMFPGQHIKNDWRKKVSRANVNNFERFDFNLKDPLPIYIDTNTPKEEWKITPNGKVHGYTYQNLSYPPLLWQALNNKSAIGRRVMNHNKMIGTFPGAMTERFVEDSKYYNPVKLPTPTMMKYTETYEKYPNEKKYLYKQFEVKTPERFQFWFFPPPKKGQLMEKLTPVVRHIAMSNNGQRVFIYDTESKRFSDVPSLQARGQISDKDARRKKSRRGSIGGQLGQPSPLMKYALLNRAKRRADEMPPPPEPSPAEAESPMSPPRVASPPSRKRSGEQSPPSPSKRAKSQSPPLQGGGSPSESPPPPPPTQQNPLYYYNEEEAGSGSESDGEEESDPKPASSKSPPSS